MTGSGVQDSTGEPAFVAPRLRAAEPGAGACSSPWRSSRSPSSRSPAAPRPRPGRPRQHLQLVDTHNPQNVSSAIQILLLVTVLSLAPADPRDGHVVHAHHRRAVARPERNRIPQLPPNQVLIGLALFLTAFVMAPAIKQINNEAVAALPQRPALAAGCVR